MKPISEKNCNLELFDLEIFKKIAQIVLFGIFLTLHYQFALILHIMIGGHDVQLFSYNSQVQSMYSCFAFCQSENQIVMLFVPYFQKCINALQELYGFDQFSLIISRSSRPEVFLGKAVLKICSKFSGEHPCRSAISIKLQTALLK